MGAAVHWLEVVCGDAGEHRRRVETRTGDLPGLPLPDWNAVLARRFDGWDHQRTVIDAARRDIASSVDEALVAIDP